MKVDIKKILKRKGIQVSKDPTEQDKDAPVGARLSSNPLGMFFLFGELGKSSSLSVLQCLHYKAELVNCTCCVLFEGDMIYNFHMS